MPDTTVHASAILADETAILIRGPSGSGKSRLAFDLILAGGTGQIPRCTLIGDDRVRLSVDGKTVFVDAVPELHGLLEIRGLGIRLCDYTQQGPVGLVVDLQAADAARMPEPAAMITILHGIQIPRIPVESGQSALPLVLAALLTRPFG